MRAKELIERLTRGDQVTLFESIVVPEVGKALQQWVKSAPKNHDWLLIGGTVVGFYTKPRATMDVDVLFKGETLPQDIVGFKKNRPHAYLHKDTHVEVEALTPDYLKLPIAVVNKVFDTSVEINNVNIPSAEGLVALKLHRQNLQDLADIQAIAMKHKIDLSDWPIDPNLISRAESKIDMKLSSR